MSFKNCKYRESEVYQAYLDLANSDCDSEDVVEFNKIAAENLIKKLRENKK